MLCIRAIIDPVQYLVNLPFCINYNNPSLKQMLDVTYKPETQQSNKL